MFTQDLFPDHFDCSECDACFPYKDVNEEPHKTYLDQYGDRYCKECAERILKEVHERKYRRVVPE